MTSDTETSTNNDNTVVAVAVALLDFALATSGALEKILKALEPHSATIIEAAENYPTAKQIEDAGWLPHPTFPIHLLEIHKDDIAALNNAITRYYEDGWEEARAAFDEQLEQRRIDSKAKALFRQAFTAHGMGLYKRQPIPKAFERWRRHRRSGPFR